MGQPQQPIDELIGAGSKIKVSYYMRPFYVPRLGAGVTLRLKAVQVLHLVRHESDFGFEIEDDYSDDEVA